MSEPVIDESTFRELQDAAGAEFVAELVATFLEEAPGMLADLRSAREAGDGEQCGQRQEPFLHCDPHTRMDRPSASEFR